MSDGLAQPPRRTARVAMPHSLQVAQQVVKRVVKRVVRRAVLPMLAVACGGGGDPSGPSDVTPTVSLSASTLTLQGVGAEGTVTATVTPAGAGVSWTSSRPDIATVTGSGVNARVVAVAAGNAVIAVQATSGSRRADAQLTVQVVPIVRRVSIDSTGATILVGQSRQLRARVTADRGADSTVRWSTSAPLVATVDGTGLVTAVSAGAVRIDATSTSTASITASVQLAVASPQVRGVTVSPSSDTLPVGATRRLTAVVDADAGLGTGVSWTSAAPAVAVVSNDGSVSAVSVGTTQITARSLADTSRRAQASVVVRPPVVRAVTIASVPGLREREQFVLQSSVDAEAGADTRLTWASSDSAVAVISADGVLVARRSGTASITAQSMAFNAVRATRTITVTPSPPFLTWARQPVGVVGTLRAEGSPLGLLSRSATRTMVTLIAYDWPFPHDTVTYSWNGSDWSAIAGSRQAIPAITGLSVHENDEVIGFGGSAVADRRIYRWNGAWQVVPNPAVGTFDGSTGPQSLLGGRIAAKGRDGGFDQMLLWNGSAWSELRRWGRPANYNQGLMWMVSPTVGFLHQTWQGGYNTLQYTAPSTMTLMPLPLANSLFFPIFRGSTVDSLWALGANDTRLHRWNGSTWVVYNNGWPAGQSAAVFDLCSGVPVVLMTDGRVYRWQTDQFRQLGTDADVLAGEGEPRERQITCAPDGTIRVSSGSGAIARWTGAAWVLESFTPRFSSVSAASATLAWAGSTLGRIYRLNGTTWEESYRPPTFAPTGAIRSMVSWADGRVVALRGSNIVLRRGGGTWTQETGGELAGVNAVWGPNADLVFAARADGRIIRSVNGGSWQPVTPAGAALTAIDGLGTTHAIAIGNSLRTLRWDGTTWTELLTSVPGAFLATRLHVSGANDAWVATAPVSFGQTASRILRFDGASWNQVDVSTIGGNDGLNGTTTLALFGTGPSNVYAVRGNARGARTLYRFDQSSWTPVTQLSAGAPDWVHLGSAVPGLALVAGSRGELHVSHPPER
jgi:trimeric autotransporter adhesin